MSVKSFSTEIAGKKLIIETGKLADQANGSCTVRYGDTVVLATAVMSQTIREGIDYFPLMVDYEEKLYAAGKIKGSRFIKREGRPSDEAILTARLVDRALRPFFDEKMRNDVQVVITVLSIDDENDPDIISLIAASCAVYMSNIPWQGPVGCLRVGRVNGEWVLNPSNEAREKSEFDLVMAGTGEKVAMMEAEAEETAEGVILEAIEFGQKHMKKITKLIEEVRSEVGAEKIKGDTEEIDKEEKEEIENLEKKVKDFTKDKLKESLNIKDKLEREEAITKIKDELNISLKEDNEISKERRERAAMILQEMLDKEAKRLMLEEEERVDGRKLDEVRPVSCQVGLLPRTHGSGLFNRGETQVLSIVTLGSPGDEQLIDTMEESGKKHYMHHYNFPGFSVGEVIPMRGPKRREIGHGALAEKAVMPLLPDKEDFPYTIRVVSEVLSSNGSSSQASVCGSSLALMDAGVPLKKAVAGIAMGIIMDDQEKEYKILTDIQGIEDHSGGMDFKVAGTRDGITAIQLDVKISGLTLEICRETLEKAKQARLKILETMNKIIPEPRKELSEYSPRIETLKIDPEKIRDVIGRGGETINEIIEECGGRDITKIDIEDDGLVLITSSDAKMSEKALEWVKQITREIEVGEIYEGDVIQIIKDRNNPNKEIGAIVEILPEKDGMVHISEFSHKHINKVSDLVDVGDHIKVKVMEVDKERGRIGLSVKALTESKDKNYHQKKRDKKDFRKK
ncbi:MAG: polyribonucleotide nucleotidyltransferase [Patescibacteria group bacterium]|nr:polyribonucleotide nucleotidyltransferase [Patescibacteria group bacterium]